MQTVRLLSIGVLCLAGLAYAVLDSLTKPQLMPPSAGRSSTDVTPSSIETPDPEAPLTPLDEYIAALADANEYLQTVDSYTAHFVRQERKDDELLDREEVAIKIRHEPFSVYMNWDEGEQQVLYVEGEHDGKLLVQRRRGLFRRVRLEPTSRMAMKDSRYPIQELGMLELVLNAQEALFGCPTLSDVQCLVETTELDGQTVRLFTVDFPSPEIQQTYSHCEICFSEESPMPVCITSHGWTEEGEPGGLIEHYYYQDLQINPGLTDLDFDKDEYGF